MRNNPRGMALIIDNEEFVNDTMPRREGSQLDANNLDILFEELGFKVHSYNIIRTSKPHQEGRLT